MRATGIISVGSRRSSGLWRSQRWACGVERGDARTAGQGSNLCKGNRHDCGHHRRHTKIMAMAPLMVVRISLLAVGGDLVAVTVEVIQGGRRRRLDACRFGRMRNRSQAQRKREQETQNETVSSQHS